MLIRPDTFSTVIYTNLMLWHLKLVRPTDTLISGIQTSSIVTRGCSGTPGRPWYSQWLGHGFWAHRRRGTSQQCCTSSDWDLLLPSSPPHYYPCDLESFFSVSWSGQPFTTTSRSSWGNLSQGWWSSGRSRPGLNLKIDLVWSWGCIASRDAPTNLMRKVFKMFNEIPLNWILPLHDLFDTAFRSQPSWILDVLQSYKL